MAPALAAAPEVPAVQLPAFVTVPETTLPGGIVVPAFEVARYLSSRDDSGALLIAADRMPWVEIDYHAARAACTAAGYKLITELQALALSYNIATQPANWTGGAVGEGKLFQGLRSGDFDEAQAASYVPSSDDERRYFALSNGERVCDVSGNAFTWVFDDVQGDSDGLVARAFAKNSPSITTATYPSMQRGAGWQPRAGSDWSGGALVRGGCFLSEDYAGVFRLGDGWPGGADDDVGFRCTK